MLLCLDKGVAYAVHCAWYMRKDMVYYSENQGARYVTKAIMPQSASLTQNMNIMHLKNQGIRQHTWHTVGPIEKCTSKIHGAKIDGTNAQCCLVTDVAWPWVDDSRHPPESL